MGAKEPFVFSISEYIEDVQITRMLDNVFCFSLMLDESTYPSLEKHLVLCATFLY
jgi:hypothetical protein